ncbi:RHS repeat domain-containing protein [Myceligenerans xiligouense]|uniref:RHS repeat domain-containing protein n=1 Tax=Myceligenerans xiligouense TaxID=253184 RepID=UPI001476F689|nr:RHS repeat-associated core domain-containing protein [Myceligenerans xiligouense]
MSVDTSALAGSGTEIASRLRLVELPACALTTPTETECQTWADLTDPADQPEDVVSGVIEIPETADTSTRQQRTTSLRAAEASASEQVVVLAVAAGDSGDEGDWKATPLSSAASWEASGSSGSFTWSYPMRAPDTAGGLVPDVSLAYDSGSVDGMVASVNTQTSEIGEGWQLSAGGYIERKFVPCTDDQAAVGGQDPNNKDHDSGDLCWKNDNATLVLGGTASDLVKDEGTGDWHLEADDNTNVEHLTGGWNGDNNKEYWKVTTSDGTQYWFGRDKRAADDPISNLYSAWTVPVFGNHPGEPCYKSASGGGFAESSCKQAWRWNLDYVVDTSGNSMTYRYGREWNNYGRNNNETDVAAADYVRGGFLRQIDFGTRADTLTKYPQARMVFTYAERCIETSSFDCGTLNSDTRDHWPDVPQNLICSTTADSCENRLAPTFFTRKRLTGVETLIKQADTTLRSVDSWELTHSFPDSGDGLDALWLNQVQHTGNGTGNAMTLPATQFGSVQMDNRVAAGLDRSAMSRMRIGQIRTESGAMISVVYSDPDCTSSDTPSAPETNTRRCMPVWWTPEGAEDPIREWFHKYVVKQVTEDSRDGGSDPTVTSYSYPGNAAWRYVDDELTLKKHRTWSDWRGYATVDEYTGDTVSNPDITRLHTRYRYFRGMHGDRQSPTGGTKSVQIDGINDLDQWSGMVREEITYNGSAVVDRTVNTPWRSTATATSADGDKAYYTGIEKTRTTTTAPDRAAGDLVSEVNTTYDSRGRVETVSDLGDIGTGSDDTCTRTTYVTNPDKNILDTIRREETVAVKCAATPSRPADVIADQRYAYDGGQVGDAPTRGRVTASQEVKSYSGGSPSYVDVERTTYDTFGRPVTVKDAQENVTSTSYATVQNLTTGTTVTTPDPDGGSGPLAAHETVSELDPAWGVPTKVTGPDGRVTEGSYDALGRLRQVWKPGRVKGQDTASVKYWYGVRDTGVNGVRTETLTQDGSGYRRSFTIYDGLLRERQTQAASASDLATGRVVTDTTYDTRGLATLNNHAWHTSGDPAFELLTTSAAVPGRTLTEYDGAGRATRELFQVDEDAEDYDNGTYVLKWETRTQHRGDRTLVTPPDGGTPTTTITDARGRTTAIRQHTGTTPSSDYIATTYTHDAADRLTRAVDDAGNRWTYEYDLRGRQTRTTDPDKGETLTTYDILGRVETATDARGQTLGYTYDALGRKTSMREGGTSGTVRAEWTYDLLGDGTRVPGQPASTTRYVGTGTDLSEIVTTVDGYEVHGQPTATTTTIPQTVNGTDLGELARSWTTTYEYTVSGLPDKTGYQFGGGIPSETMNLAYDSADQPSGLESDRHGIYVAAADYKPTGEPARFSLGNTHAYVQDWDYEFGTNRLKKSTVVAEDPSGVAVDVRRASYTWDHAGNLTSVFDTPAADLGGRAHDRQCYDYDGLGRLVEAWTPATAGCGTAPTSEILGGAAAYWNTYSHDSVGNRTSVVEHAVGSGSDITSTYDYPEAGGAAGTQPHGVTQVEHTGAQTGTSSFTYDDAGNMTGRDQAGQTLQELSWDAEGELAAVAEDTDGDGTISTAEQDEADGYVYTADGERILRTQDGATTLYLGHQELTLDHSTGTVSGQRYYTFGGMTIATRTGYNFADVDTIISDQQGTGTVQIPNVDGPAHRVHRYTDPYGKPRGPQASQPGAGGGADGDWTGEHGFLDKPIDATGLTAIGARMYDPTLGRFISVDPVMDLTDPQQWNGYAYSHNNPTTFTDPTGMREICDSGHTCNYGKGGGITKQKKKAKPRPRPATVESTANTSNWSWWTTLRARYQAYNEGFKWIQPKPVALDPAARTTTYTGADPLVQRYIQSAHFQSARQATINELMTNGSYVRGSKPLDHGYAAGRDGLGSMRKNLMADARTHFGSEYYSNGEYENIAIALLGSHELSASPVTISFNGGGGDRRTAVIQYVVKNDTTLASATRVGYNSPNVDSAKNWIAEGSFGGRVSQEFVWYERYTYDYQGR